MISIGIDIFRLKDGRLLSFGGFCHKMPDAHKFPSNPSKDSGMNDYLKLKKSTITIDQTDQSINHGNLKPREEF